MTIRLAIAAFVVACFAALPAQAQNWNTTIAKTERGYRIGNPDAPIQLITFESYTCPVCGQFERESEAALRMVYIHEGRAAVEIRSVIHSPIDLAASLAVQCGPTSKFLANHHAMFIAQRAWLEKLSNTSAAQRARWSSGYLAQRMRAIASDLDFYELMERRGYSRVELDRCLTDESRAIAISNNAAADGMEFAIPGTPSFAVNGSLVANAHTWERLRPALESVPQ